MADDSLHEIREDIREMNRLLNGVVGTLAGTDQKIDGLNDRLFGTSGSIPALWAKAASLDGKIELNAAAVSAVKSSLGRQKAYVAGLTTAGGVVGTGIAIALKGFFSKFGIHL